MGWVSPMNLGLQSHIVKFQNAVISENIHHAWKIFLSSEERPSVCPEMNRIFCPPKNKFQPQSDDHIKKTELFV